MGALGQIEHDAEPAAQDRVAQFFAEHAQQSIEQFGGSKPAPDFCERLGLLLRQAIREHATHVDRLVAAGLPDPIKLKADNIVPMGLNEGPQTGFVAATVDDTMVSWMNDTAPVPAIVEQWRSALRSVYAERKQRRMTPGS